MGEVESGHGEEGRKTPRTDRQDQQVGKMEAVAEGVEGRDSVREVWKVNLGPSSPQGSQGRKSVEHERGEPSDTVSQLSHVEGTPVGADIEPQGGVIFVPGQPVPAPRIKVGRWGAYYGKQYGEWLPAAREFLSKSWDGGLFEANVPVKVLLNFRIARPKSHFGTGRNSMKVKARFRERYPIPGGDVDNLAKGPLDALVGAALADDKQVVQLQVTKHWTMGQSEVPGVRIEVERAENYR